MSERALVVDHLKLRYEGLFNAGELFNLISTWFFGRHWDWYERLNEEQITPSGKQVQIVLEPWKNISDYYKIQIRIKLNYTDLQEVEVEHERQRLKLNQGVVHLTMDAYVISDRKGMWSKKPFYWFLSVLANKYFFREHYQKAETWIKSDVDDLYQAIKNYLNVFKYTYQS